MEDVTAQRAASVAPSRVPEPYVRAEVEAWPLTSLSAFRCGLTELDPLLEAHREERPTFWLWRDCEEALAQHASGWSLDRLVSARDFSWFNVTRDERKRLWPVPMHQYLRHLAEAHLEPRYGSAELCHTPGASTIDVIYHYYWLTFAMPEDLLLAAVPIQPPPRHVNLGGTLFQRRLSDQGIAEIHQHSGAGVDFPLVWAGALAKLADPDLSEDVMKSPGAPFADGRAFSRWLLVAAIARVVLGEFLMLREGPRRCDRDWTLGAYLRASFDRPSHQRRTLTDALFSLVRAPGGEPPCFHDLHYLYTNLFWSGIDIARDPPRSLDDAWRCDPICARRGLSEYGDGERWLVRHGLEYLEWRTRSQRRPDREFAGAFWQVQRLRCLLYRYIVERPLTSGLQWFLRFYNRINRLTQPVNKVRTEANFRVAGGGPLRFGRVVSSLELRRAVLSDDPFNLAEMLHDIVESWRQVLKYQDTEHMGTEAELGMLVEFVKDRDPGQLWDEGGPWPFGEGTYAQPGSQLPGKAAPDLSSLPIDASFNARLSRFGRVFTQFAPKAWAVADLLCAEPELLWLVRGVDVCSDELAVPTWVLVPFYRYLRQESEYASLLGGRHGAPPLRATAHVGEDYRHLREGLRRIYESCQYLLGRSGGRLGHATALGIDPRAWAESAAPVLVPVEERLWDLVFEWRLYSDSRVPPEFRATAPAGRIERLNNLIMEQAEEILGSVKPGLTPRALADVYERLHEFLNPRPGQLMQRGDLDRAMERGAQRFFGKSPIYETLWEHLQDPAGFRRGQKLRDISVDANDVEAMLAVQDALRRGIAKRGIVVEVNPTSNLLIGNLLDLRHHPLLRLCPIEPKEGTPRVKVAIGSDDPIVFSTSLLHEYELVEMTAREAGYSEETVHRWLDGIRQTAFDARFTLPWRPRAADRTDRLIAALERYLQAPKRSPRPRRVSRLSALGFGSK